MYAAGNIRLVVVKVNFSKYNILIFVMVCIRLFITHGNALDYDCLNLLALDYRTI